MSEEKTDETGAVGVVLSLIAWMVICLAGWISTSHWWSEDIKAYRSQAVLHGAAEWHTAPDGTTTFHWKDVKL